MTALVCARCAEMVITDSRIPTIPTKIPTRRVLGSAACSGVTSISVMTHALSDRLKVRIAARNSEDAAAHYFYDFTECADLGDESAYLAFRAGELDDRIR